MEYRLITFASVLGEQAPSVPAPGPYQTKTAAEEAALSLMNLYGFLRGVIIMQATNDQPFTLVGVVYRRKDDDIRRVDLDRPAELDERKA